MKFIMLKKASKRELYESKSNAKLIILAFLCAVSAWFIITITKYPTKTVTIKDFPLVLNTKGTTAGDNNLEIINQDVQYIDISFECSLTDYNRLNAKTVEAYVDFSNISIAGPQTLSIKVKPKDENIAIKSIQTEPSMVTLELDEFSTETFNLYADIPNLEIPENKYIDENGIYPDPVEITVNGPVSKLADIDNCCAVYDKNIVLTSSVSNLTSSRIMLLDANGKEIDQKQNHITITPSVVNINADVMAMKSVPFTPKFISSSENFDPESLNTSFTPSEVTLIGDTETIESMQSIEILIQLDDFDIGKLTKTYNFTKRLPAGTKAIDDSETTEFAISAEGLDSKEVTISKFIKVNEPNNDYIYNIETKTLTVKLIGPAETVKDITASELQAEVDLFGIEKETLQFFQIDVKISCKTHTDVWAVIKSKVNVSRTPKSEPTTALGNSS